MTGLFSVAGKTAVVTGGGKGVGAMISAALLDGGCRVLVISRHADADGKLAVEREGRAGCEFLSFDLATVQGVADAAAEVARMAPRLDILINNSGAFSAGPVEAADPARWDMEMALNLRAPFFLVQALLPTLRAAAAKEAPARIVNIGSIGGLWAKSSSAYAYGSSKAGLHQLTRMLASDLTSGNLTVNAIAPGFFPSDMTAGFFGAVPGLEAEVIRSIPAGRLGTPEDIAGAVLFLCSRAGAYVSGAVIPLEGGLLSA